MRDTPALLVVDSVSGLAGVEMKMDAWGVDIVVSASQKSLMCPPGLGFAAISAKAWQVINRDGRVPILFRRFSPRPRLTRQGRHAVHAAGDAGLRPARGAAHDRRGRPCQCARAPRPPRRSALRAGVQALGLELYNQPNISSPTVVAMKVPQGLEGGAIVQHMRERYGTVIAGARHPSQTGKVIRIGTMGTTSEADIITDLRHLEATLKDLGGPAPTPHAGVRAALDALAVSA